MKGQDALFSSEKQDWETPEYLFDYFNNLYGFDIDLAASAKNAKCARFYSVEEDSLKQDWNGEVGWCNPEYNNIEPFLNKAVGSRGTFVFLLPSRTCRNWYHDYVLPHASEIYWIRGRIKFEGAKASAPFPSLVVVFDSNKVNQPQETFSLNPKEIMANKKQAYTIANAEVLRQYLSDFYAKEGLPPTVEEMIEDTGLKNIPKLLEMLVAEGKIRRGPAYPDAQPKQGRGKTAKREYVVI